jgi:hypothetical protein
MKGDMPAMLGTSLSVLTPSSPWHSLHSFSISSKSALASGQSKMAPQINTQNCRQ